MNMKQDEEQYWSQHKVFFVATLILFPDKLTAQPLDPWFFRPYFNFVYGNDFDKGLNKDDPSLEWAATLLDDYRKSGYIKYKKVESLYKITDIDTKKAKKDLMQYLKQWQRNELLALSASKPPDAVRQKELLLVAIVHDYADHKNEQRITLKSVYGKPNDYAYEPPFWELVLSYQLLDKKIKITYMNYARRDDGLYDDNVQPLVDLKIIDKELSDLIKQRLAQTDKPVVPTTPSDIVSPDHAFNRKQSLKATIVIMDNTIYVALEDEREYRISRQLRTDLPPLIFINHLLHHPRTSLSRHDVKEATGSSDITELVRRCGFSKQLKKIFFPDTTEQNVYFQPAPIINESQVKLLAEHKWDKVRKGGTT